MDERINNLATQIAETAVNHGQLNAVVMMHDQSLNMISRRLDDIDENHRKPLKSNENELLKINEIDLTELSIKTNQ